MADQKQQEKAIVAPPKSGGNGAAPLSGAGPSNFHWIGPIRV